MNAQVEIVELKDSVDRDAEGVCCPKCKGYAENAEVTKEEDYEYGCGRFMGCCSRAFICKLCGARILGKAEAPEYVD